MLLVVQEILKNIDADLYALIDFESTNPESYLYKRTIGTTIIQNLLNANKSIQKYLPLLPLTIEQLDLKNYEVVLSSCHAVANFDRCLLCKFPQFLVRYLDKFENNWGNDCP